MKTSAAILVHTGEPLAIWDIEIPVLRSGQVLVEVNFSGACRTQVLEAWGMKGEDKWLPHCLGHEGVGTVLETGAAVQRVKAGDRVIMSWLKGDGIEAGGAKYLHQGSTVNSGAVTTFQKIAVCSENRLSLIPEGLKLDHAVMLGCALPTGYGCVVNTGRAKPGESIAVFGAGGIGLSAIMTAAAIGLSPVIAIDISDEKLAMAKSFGATLLVNPASENMIEAIRTATAGKGVDLAVEATGSPTVMRAALESVRAQGGRAVIAGNANFGEDLSISPSQLNQGKSLLGTWGGDSVPDRDFPVIAQLMTSGRIDVSPLLTKRYALTDINRALTDLKDGKVGRPLIDMALT
jgi:S-(hydroxymethyl)glutathione dehydrogenase / alcohol dehydrogenase